MDPAGLVKAAYDPAFLAAVAAAPFVIPPPPPNFARPATSARGGRERRRETRECGESDRGRGRAAHAVGVGVQVARAPAAVAPPQHPPRRMQGRDAFRLCRWAPPMGLTTRFDCLV